ncbi:phage antirepressor Ant [Corynebacterium diphtheriae]|nr:phage antirepressor Ant [Corynebacterium diphtheriae]CAB1035196.1 phage antirepressor Ant [Corynebacterium diphtheriae]
MSDLIPLANKDGIQAVMGRDLHQFLEVRRDYTNWMKQMIGYGFTEGRDFELIKEKVAGHAGSPNLANTRHNHIISLDMAKEISMIQRTDKGKQARQYFIECEKRAQSAPQLTGAQLMAKALLEAESTMKELEARATTAEAILEASAPALEYHEKFIAEDDDLTKIDDFARTYGSTGPKVREMLADKNIAFRTKIGHRWSDSKQMMEPQYEWRARAGRATYDWFRLCPQHNAPRLHNGQVRQTLYVKTFHMNDLAKRLGLEPKEAESPCSQ